ncbi:tryptophan synthase subunit alpha [Paenibacillus rigui]|uniref:Tryptophan synthase alpha chain n=1 Tax=Paenibacillus rigui TaxID=554312 RepID=A0A229UPN0_9BACL|nr:tryptophan synthase subunit alpha [Paenibacillus rigui]OXM84859.1 tryptophan synthase subunit alpha [Paenibacillus rigui]
MKNGLNLSTESIRNMQSKMAQEIREKRKSKQILIMTHQILGYPDFETNYEMIRLFHECGVDLIELQLPFSEPTADGPVFLRANQASLERGTTVEQCLDFARKVTAEFNIPFIFMTYYNILYQYGVERFIAECSRIGIRGLIVPDAFPEESQVYMEACRTSGVDPILIVTPYTPPERLAYLSSQTGGFLYCVARKGVTGSRTTFEHEQALFLESCRQAAHTPTAVGFGIQDRSDVQYLTGKTDIAIIGTQLLKVLEAEGLSGVRSLLHSMTAS